MGQAVRSQRLGIERTGAGERAWLSMLIDTMENISRRDVRNTSCDATLLSGVRLQLGRSVAPHRRANHAVRKTRAKAAI